ncbi:hypothetical protein LUU34_01127400 [Aix galericulata]|nr:hypothetical protein LUU34_01127400 [Aix galericulata]
MHDTPSRITPCAELLPRVTAKHSCQLPRNWSLSVSKLGRNSRRRARGDDCASPPSLLMFFRAASSPQDHIIKSDVPSSSFPLLPSENNLGKEKEQLECKNEMKESLLVRIFVKSQQFRMELWHKSRR